MNVSEQELRQLVREAIARHMLYKGTGVLYDPQDSRPLVQPLSHASHMLLPLAAGSDLDGACLIEPTVRCVHCGYCLSYGH